MRKATYEKVIRLTKGKFPTEPGLYLCKRSICLDPEIARVVSIGSNMMVTTGHTFITVSHFKECEPEACFSNKLTIKEG